jgi:nucleotide-binding universal stress UspA family protein
MKNILVTTDFSSAANNAIEYAAKFAQKMNKPLTIANFELSEPVPEPMICRYIRDTPEILEEISETVHKTYSIPCSYIVERTNKTLQKAMENISSDTDLIIMGTNGADDIYQYFLGTNAFHVAKKVKSPVLIIPEGIVYKPIDKVVFAWDYTRDNTISFLQLNALLENYHPEITFLHISHQKTIVSDEVFNALKEEVSSQFPNSKNIRFERVFCKDSENFPDKLLEYTDDSNADLLTVTYYDRGMFQNIFHGSITKKLSETVTYPLLVLHA